MKSTYWLGIVAGVILSGTAGATDRYVWTNGSPDGTYATWATAATNIQDAVNKAAAGETVWVTNGLYALTNQIVVTNGIFVRSFNNDPANTVIYRRVPAAATNRIFYVSNTAAVVSGFTVTNGAAREVGGGVLLAAGTVSNCVIAKNIINASNLSGGGIYVGAQGLLVDSVVSLNTFGKDGPGGAGVSIYGGTVRRCQISENYCATPTSEGGGVYLKSGLLEYSFIYSNNINNLAGGVKMDSGTMRNCLIYGNTASDSGKSLSYGGGVVAANTTNCFVENCTIAGNTARNAGGVYGGLIRNSIVYFNQALSGEGDPNFDGGAVFTNSCTTPPGAGPAIVASTFGEGNRFDDPGFVNPDARDYRLRPGSPAVDGGTNLGWMSGAKDLAGNARLAPVDGTNDMGAFEYHAGSLMGYFSADVTAGLDSQQVVFTAAADGTNLAGIAYSWDFENNGSTDATGPATTNTYSAGLYSVKLTVANAIGESSSFVRSKYIAITPSTPICVWTNGSATPPYDTWAKALTNIADAVTLAAGGSSIIVTNGTYVLSGQITLGLPVTLLSATGPTNTIIQGSGYCRLLFITNELAIVDGFTLRNGTGGSSSFPQKGATFGGGVHMTAGTVRNCFLATNSLKVSKGYGSAIFMTGNSVVSNCQVFGNTGAGDGKGGGVAMQAGVLVNSLVYGNTLPGSASQGGGVTASGGQVINCQIYSNTITTGTRGYGGGLWLSNPAMAVNCLIYSNTVTGAGADLTGGGIYGGAAINCTVVNNAAKVAGGGTYNTTLTNSIVCFNSVTNNSAASNNWVGGNMAYSCTTPTNGLTGAGNTDADPLFLNPAAKNFRLTASSPCFNQGTYLAWMTATRDLDGHPRVSGGLVDMGAYELLMKTASGTVIVIK